MVPMLANILVRVSEGDHGHEKLGFDQVNPIMHLLVSTTGSLALNNF